MSDSIKKDETGGGRDAATGRFVPGYSGGGRKAIPPEIREMLQAAVPDAVRRLIAALDAERPVVAGADINMFPDHDMRTKAAEAILNRLYGKPAVAVTGDDGGPVRIGADTTVLEMLKKLAGP